MDKAYRIKNNIIADDVRLLYLERRRGYAYKMFHSDTVINTSGLKVMKKVNKKHLSAQAKAEWFVPKFFTKNCDNMDEIGFCAGHFMDRQQFIDVFCDGVEPPEMSPAKETTMTEKEETKAYKQIKQLVETNPGFGPVCTDRETYYTLGVAYGKLGMYKDALEAFKDAFKQVIKIKPNYAPAHLGLGLTYFYLNLKSFALEQYKILKDLDAKLAKKLFKKLIKGESHRKERRKP